MEILLLYGGSFLILIFILCYIVIKNTNKQKYEFDAKIKFRVAQEECSMKIVDLICTRNSFPLIGDQFEHLDQFEKANQIRINHNLESYIK